MDKGFTRAGFIRAYVVPALLLFAIPALAYPFAIHARDGWDAKFLAAVTEAVQKDPEVAPAQAAEIGRFFREYPASLLCERDRERLPPSFADEACGDYAQLGWIVQVSLGSALLGLLSVLVSVVCVSLSFLSRQAQYLSFVAGWNFLRVASAIQVLAQGFLAVMLSFWVTAYFFERYYVKLIGAMGIIALMAAGSVILAIFKKPDDRLEVEGEPLPRDRSPELWGRIEAMCSRLGTSPPNHVIGGIDNNFFVTEHPVHASGRVLEGRSLFISLSLLKRLEKSEADAILAHEMAHFSGGDTLYSKKLAPQLARFGQYIQALAKGGISMPIAYFMLFYWSMFQISLGRTKRQRELRADTIAAETTSAQSMANALLKVSAYSSYRGRVENGLFERNRSHSELDIAHSVAVGFAEYAKGPALADDLDGDDAFPHPFDSHPSLTKRLENVKVEVAKDQVAEIVASTAARTWFNEIGDAERIEAELWKAYQERFRAAHEVSLVYRYLPATPEERAHVERVFPPLALEGKKDGASLRVDCLQFHYQAWQAPVEWSQIKDMNASEIPFVGKVLNIRYHLGGSVEKCQLPLHKLVEKDDGVIEIINRYYGRFMAARANAGSPHGHG
jgi:Zn-dependent protease with chaperone function